MPLKDAKDLVVGLVPKAGVKAVRDRMPDDKAKARARKFWSFCESVVDDDPVDRYLKQRLDKKIRSHAIRIGMGRHIADPEQVFPIMASRVDDENGNIVSIHRTYLNRVGQKADVSPVKVLMAGTIPTGSAIRLFSSVAEEMGIAEGVETALAAFLTTGVPTWSAISAPLLRSFNPPASVKRLTIFSDNDANYTGQAAAYDLARRLVMSRKIEVVVRVPVMPDTDFLDQMRGNDEQR
jgi:putative DNA primase/helicase